MFKRADTALSVITWRIS